jgi:sugar phosphate isomerase/epimerase
VFRLGYNTNGLAHHRVEDALRLLDGLGYRAASITPDVGQLDLYRLDRAEVRRVRRLARELDLSLAVETGARFLLDARRKHFPTLLETAPRDRARRVDFLRRSIDLAADLGAPLVSIWSGAAPRGATGDPAGRTPGSGARTRTRAARAPSPAVERLWDRLVAGLMPVLDHARGARVRIAFEPEPGMFVERPTGYLELVRRLGERGPELGLTLDVGHLVATGDLPVPREVRALAPYLSHVQLDDAPRGRHEHRMFGAGVLDLAGTLAALRAAGFRGQAAVELSRDSFRGAEAAAEAMGHLRAAARRR